VDVPPGRHLKKIITYTFALVFATGLLFLWFPKPSIIYQCAESTNANEFSAKPRVFIASPFIYKSPSEIHSFGYDYYLVGVIGNIIVWSIFVLLIRLAIIRTFLKNETKQKRLVYNIVKYSLSLLFIVTTTFSIYATYRSIEFKADFESNRIPCSSTYKSHFDFASDLINEL
jgi:hypothetical protein